MKKGIFAKKKMNNDELISNGSIKLSELIVKIRKLKSSKKRLENMYSDEKKNSIEINNILSTIDNEQI